MHYFNYCDGELFCENVPVRKIVEVTGTPVYIYSAKTIKRHFKVFDSAFNEIPHLVCYSVKANSNLAVLKLLGNLGAGADIVSGGELKRVLKAGISPEKVVFSGVGKTPQEIEFALSQDILMFNVESPAELFILEEVAKKLGKKARFSLRVNPNVDPKTHPYISTGLKKNKFGIPEEEVMELYLKTKNSPYLEAVGIDAHIGSQLTLLSPFIDALKHLKTLWKELIDAGFNLRYLDLGGGLGIVYKDEEPPLPQEYAEAIIKEIKEIQAVLILEPGRVIVGNAGILVTRVLYIKKNGEKKFVIVDAGMNDLIRPSFYNAYHEIVPVFQKEDKKEVVDVVGPICESGDFFAKDRELPVFSSGDLMAIMSAGAYGFVMSSNYNTRPRPPEVLVIDDRFYIVRKRETVEDLLALETIPEVLF